MLAGGAEGLRADCGRGVYSVIDQAVARARELIDARQYVLDSDWSSVQPRAEAQSAYLDGHSWDEYAL